MPDTGYSRPPINTLIEDVRTDLSARHNDDPLRRNDDEIDAAVFGGALDGLYDYISFLAKQILPDTAESEWLLRHAKVEGLDLNPAVSASGSVKLPAGAGLSIGTNVVLQAGGNDYVTTATAVEAGGFVTATAKAVTPGAAGNLEPGASISVVSPIPGIGSTGEVVVMSGGADAEKDSELLVRLLAKIQEPPHGGASHDYIAWAKEIEGVTRAWPYKNHTGAGNIGLCFVRDGDVDFIPDANEVQKVKDHIEMLRPITGELFVFPPVPKEINPQIAIKPDTPEIRMAITAELQDFLRREAVPNGDIDVSRLREAISIAAGETAHKLISPTADTLTHWNFQIAVLGTPVFSEFT